MQRSALRHSNAQVGCQTKSWMPARALQKWDVSPSHAEMAPYWKSLRKRPQTTTHTQTGEKEKHTHTHTQKRGPTTVVMAVSPSAAARFLLSASLVRNSSSGVGGSRRLYLSGCALIREAQVRMGLQDRHLDPSQMMFSLDPECHACGVHVARAASPPAMWQLHVWS